MPSTKLTQTESERVLPIARLFKANISRACVICSVAACLSTTATFGQAANQAPKTAAEKAQISQKKREELLGKIPGIQFSNSIPVNFPIPPYTSNVIRKNFSNSTKGIPTAAVNIVTSDPARNVYQWYQDVCSKGNWSVKIPSAQGQNQIGKANKLYMLQADKGDQHMSIFCVAQAKSADTIISISWEKKK
jgi:hypothetical protein